MCRPTVRGVVSGCLRVSVLYAGLRVDVCIRSLQIERFLLAQTMVNDCSYVVMIERIRECECVCVCVCELRGESAALEMLFITGFLQLKETFPPSVLLSHRMLSGLTVHSPASGLLL